MVRKDFQVKTKVQLQQLAICIIASSTNFPRWNLLTISTLLGPLICVFQCLYFPFHWCFVFFLNDSESAVKFNCTFGLICNCQAKCIIAVYLLYLFYDHNYIETYQCTKKRSNTKRNIETYHRTSSLTYQVDTYRQIIVKDNYIFFMNFKDNYMDTSNNAPARQLHMHLTRGWDFLNHWIVMTSLNSLGDSNLPNKFISIFLCDVILRIKYFFSYHLQQKKKKKA